MAGSPAWSRAAARGWVFGKAGTHDRLVRELAVGAHAAAVFPEYSPSPEAKSPVALEQCYAVARWLAAGAPGNGLDTSRVGWQAIRAEGISPRP